MSNLALYIDTFTGAALAAPTASTAATLPSIFHKDNLGLDVFFCTPTGDTRWPYKIERYASATVAAKLAAAVTSVAPASGNFKLTFGANTTSALAYNVSTAALQTALEGLASIGSGNVTVTGVAGQYYVIEFIGSLAGANQSLISGVSVDMLDSIGIPCQVNVASIQDGATNVNEMQLITLAQKPIAQATLSTEITPAGTTVTVTQAQSGDGAALHEVQRITWADKPATGYYTINFGVLGTTGEIPVNATDQNIEDAINDVLGTGKVAVSTKPLAGSASWQIEIRFTDFLDYAAVTVDITNVQFFYGWRGVLPVFAPNLLGTESAASQTPTLEIDLTPSGGAIQTVFQSSITVKRAAGA